MKLQVLNIFLVFMLSFSAFGAETRPSPIIIQNVDITTWPEALSAEDALDIFIEMIQSDPEAKKILEQVNQKLNDHGIPHLKDIFSYCPGEAGDDHATAFFWQKVRSIETRIAIPGIPAIPWSQAALAAKRNAFSSKVIKTLFTEFLAVSDQPRICIHRGKELFYTYDSVVHELTHLLLKDPFSYSEELFSSSPLPDLVQKTIFETGGEFDAFKAGSPAGIRLLRKYNIQNRGSQSHQFFSPQGVLVDEDGLKNHLVKVYSEYYSHTDSLSKFKENKRTLLQTRVQILKGNVEPAIIQLKRVDLQKTLAEEIALLESLIAQLDAQKGHP